MAQESKFAGALARLKEPPPEAPHEEPAVRQERSAAPVPTPATNGAGKGRPPTGKRSDPAWDRYTVLMRKENHKRAVRRLQDLDTGQDLSELVDELIAEWLSR